MTKMTNNNTNNNNNTNTNNNTNNNNNIFFLLRFSFGESVCFLFIISKGRMKPAFYKQMFENTWQKLFFML